MNAPGPILALDLGTRTGWAWSHTGAMESGVTVFDVRRGESPGMRFLAFRRWLEELLGLTSASLVWPSQSVLPLPLPRLVVWEAAHHRGGAATELAVGFATRVMETCAQAGIEYASVHSGTLKKFATGRGDAGKPAMLEAARDRTAYRGVSEDEADARLLLLYAQTRLVGATDGDRDATGGVAPAMSARRADEYRGQERLSRP
jgi:hypothetical protein